MVEPHWSPYICVVILKIVHSLMAAKLRDIMIHKYLRLCMLGGCNKSPKGRRLHKQLRAVETGDMSFAILTCHLTSQLI